MGTRMFRSVLTAFLAVALAAAVCVFTPGCGKGPTWDFSKASDYTFSPDVLSVGGEEAGARLKRLPRDTYWTAYYKDSRPGRGPEFHDCAVTPEGDVVVVGSVTDLATSVPGLKGELIIARYDRNGEARPGWPKLISDAHPWNEGQDVFVGADGSITVAGYSIDGETWFAGIWRFDEDGKALPGWPQYTNAGSRAWAMGVTVDSKGDVVACGASGPYQRENVLVLKYGHDGTPVPGWPRTYRVEAAQNLSYDLIEDSGGNLVVAGYTGAEPLPSMSRDAVLYKLDAAGNPVAGWPRRWGASPGSDDEYYAVSQAADGDYCLVGVTQGPGDLGYPETPGRLLVTRYTSQGEQKASWPRVYEQEGMRDYSPPDAWRGSVDSSGCIAASCTTGSDSRIETVRYAPDSKMSAGFPKTFDRKDYFEATRSTEVDVIDNIYTVGFSRLDADETVDYAGLVAKYPPAAYSTGRPSVTTRSGVAYEKLTGFREVPASGSAGKVTYQLSPDGKDWYYYDGSTWAKAAGPDQSNSGSEVDGAASAFAKDIGPGTLRVRAFLASDGSARVGLESITVTYSD